MGRPIPADEVRTFVGQSEAIDNRDQADGVLDVAKLSEALMSAAQKAIDEGLVGHDKTAWFRIDFIEVELANQHPKTVRVGMTPRKV